MYVESSHAFTEIKQVSARSLVCRGINGDKCLEVNAFILRVERPYIIRKSDKSLDMGEPTLHAEKIACY